MPGEPLYLAGCYFLATGRKAGGEQAFVAGAFRRLLDEQNCVAWSAEALKREASYHRSARLTIAAIVCCVVVLLGLVAKVFV
jgi:hypothetical protein